MANEKQKSLAKRRITIRKKAKRSVPAKVINFRPSIRKVLKRIEPNMSLKPKALVILNDALNPVNVKLVDICNRRFRPTKKKPEMGVEAAYKAVTTVFNNEVQKHALAAGHNALLKFRYGYTLYKRKGTKQTRRKQKEKRRVALAHEFKTGVPAIVRIVYPEAKIDPKARNVMCTFLNVLSARITKKVKELNSETATAVDVKNAVEAILPRTMAEHAKAEGSKMVFTLEINGFTFIPKYHKRRKRRNGGQAPVIVNLEPLIQQLPTPTSAPPNSQETS
ncbi:uncharacterized protein LOC118188293 [Stegodyphus dumicola]|uniref:uncharacterized protein LOC118188293 n=1 Tax=Stegodyphus dumicola TaxID=202533 RepID=UPI0015AE96C7|nr:uncharacterized protein LOC118188293 [Stegodyphus dumicola]